MEGSQLVNKPQTPAAAVTIVDAVAAASHVNKGFSGLQMREMIALFKPTPVEQSHAFEIIDSQ